MPAKQGGTAWQPLVPAEGFFRVRQRTDEAPWSSPNGVGLVGLGAARACCSDAVKEIPRSARNDEVGLGLMGRGEVWDR